MLQTTLAKLLITSTTESKTNLKLWRSGIITRLLIRLLLSYLWPGMNLLRKGGHKKKKNFKTGGTEMRPIRLSLNKINLCYCHSMKKIGRKSSRKSGKKLRVTLLKKKVSLRKNGKIGEMELMQVMQLIPHYWVSKITHGLMILKVTGKVQRTSLSNGTSQKSRILLIQGLPSRHSHGGRILRQVWTLLRMRSLIKQANGLMRQRTSIKTGRKVVTLPTQPTC